MKTSLRGASTRIICSRPNWMIEVGRTLKKCHELELVGFDSTAGSIGFLNRLACNDPFDIVSTGEVLTLRRC